MDHAVSPNPQQVGTRVEPHADGTDPIGSSLEVHTTIRRNDLFILPVLAVEDIEDHPHDVGQQNRPSDQDGAHAVQRLANVDLATRNGDEPPANEQLQQTEQEDVRAVRNALPELPISDNVISPRHYWLILRQLKDKLRAESSHGMLFAQEYARILQRLARVLTTLTKEDYDTAPCVHPLCYECVLIVLKEKTPDFSCPVDFSECLDRLCEDITATASMIRVADVVYVIKDREQYARRLRSLAALVSV